jgi:histidinol-phosphate aminotransferase
VAASAALAETAQVVSTREGDCQGTVALALCATRTESTQSPHTDSRANFVFFDAGRPQPILAAAMRERGVDIGRAHPLYTNWAQITIGLPSENLCAQNVLRAGLKETDPGSGGGSHRPVRLRSKLSGRLQPFGL